MKKTLSPPGLLADIATLIAMVENVLDVLESVEPDEPRIWKRALIKRNKAGEKKPITAGIVHGIMAKRPFECTWEAASR
jgi:hypothetical protein